MPGVAVLRAIVKTTRKFGATHALLGFKKFYSIIRIGPAVFLKF